MFDKLALMNEMALQGIGVKALAQKAGVNYGTFVSILNKEGHTPNLVTIGRLAAALHIEPKKLLKDEAAIIAANDGWIPVEQGLPLHYEIVAVTIQDKRIRRWMRAFVNDSGQWRKDTNPRLELPGVIAWKRIEPWKG